MTSPEFVYYWPDSISQQREFPIGFHGCVQNLCLPVSTAETPDQPSHGKSGNVFLRCPRHPLQEVTGKQGAMKWPAHSQRKQLTWESSSSCPSRRRTTGCCLLLNPVDISRDLSGLSMHIAMLKRFNTARQQGRLSRFQAMLNLHHKSVLKCLLHSRLIFSECRNISRGDADCFLRTQLKHSQVVKWSRRIQWKELSLLI